MEAPPGEEAFYRSDGDEQDHAPIDYHVANRPISAATNQLRRGGRNQRHMFTDG